MHAIHRSEGKPLDTPHGIEGRRLHETDHVQATHVTLQPGAAMQPHSSPSDAFFYVLEGRGVIEAEGESFDACEGTLIHSDAGTAHLWRNEAEAPLRILVVKTPNPGPAIPR